MSGFLTMNGFLKLLFLLQKQQMQDYLIDLTLDITALEGLCLLSGSSFGRPLNN